MSNTVEISPWQIIAQFPELLETLTDTEMLALAHDPGFRLRVNQQPPHGNWKSLGYIAARGVGKTYSVVMQIHDIVNQGRARAVCVIAQDEQRTEEICVENLVKLSPPWNRCIRFRNQLRWDNGAVGYICTPEAPDKIRGANYDLMWATELVGWSEFTGAEAWHMARTATRIGEQRVIWDTTAKGYSEVIKLAMAPHENDPYHNPIVRGVTFDNVLFSKDYLQAMVSMYGVGSRRYREEILGEIFDNAEGAIWQRSWIDDNRVDHAPANLVKIVGYDPASSERKTADASGIVVAGRDSKGHVYVLEDRTAKYSAETVGKEIVQLHAAGAVGVVIETNHLHKFATQNIRGAASQSGIKVQELGKEDKFPDRRNAQIIYVREVHSRGKKLERAEPVTTLYSQGRVHHVGVLSKLEKEQLTYDGSGLSPNAFDAANMVIAELGGLRHDSLTRDAAARQTAEVNRVNQALKTNWSVRARTRSPF